MHLDQEKRRCRTLSKIVKGISLSVVLGLLMAVLVSPAFAAEEVRVRVRGSGSEKYVTVSNVVDQKPEMNLLVANAPATVTFLGENLAMERITFFATGGIKDGELQLDGDGEPVTFDVKKYTNPGETEVLDALVAPPEDIPVYVTGNYATLSKPGYYVVAAAPEAVAPTFFYIQVTAQAGGETPATPKPAAVTAAPTSAKVLVDGRAVSFDAYLINGNNYFKLRDLAMVVSSSEKEFEVAWDGEKNAINLLTGQAYTSVGGELALSGKSESQTAALTDSKIYVNGKEIQLTAYKIGGNNYFKLRDVAKAIGFGVTWDPNTSTIGIDTKSPYTE